MKGFDLAIVRGVDFAVVGGCSIFLLLCAWVLGTGAALLLFGLVAAIWGIPAATRSP